MTNITIKYYNVYITHNNAVTNINFNLFLDYIMNQKVKQVDNLYLKKMKQIEFMINTNDRLISLADYRIRKPKKGEKHTDNYDNIDDDIFEQTNCFYQHSDKLFIMEYNHYGAKLPAIKKYFDSFLPEDTKTDKWAVEFFEIPSENTLSDVLQGQDITRLDIQLNISSQQINYLRDITQESLPYTEQLNTNQDIREKVIKYIDKTFQEMIHTSNLFGGQNRLINFTRGRKRRALDVTAIKTLLNYLDLESELFQSVIIDYKDCNGRVHQNVNLKHAKVLSMNFDCLEDDWRIIADGIENYYYHTSNQLGNGYHKRNSPTEFISLANYPFSSTLVFQ